MFTVNPNCVKHANNTIQTGSCSTSTESKLQDEACATEIFQLQPLILNTIHKLIINACSQELTQYYNAFIGSENGPGGIGIVDRSSDIKKTGPVARFVPILTLGNIKTEIPFEHTRNR